MKYRIIKRGRFTIENGFEEEYEPQKKGGLWPFWKAVQVVDIDGWGNTAPKTFETEKEARDAIEKSQQSYGWIEEKIEIL